MSAQRPDLFSAAIVESAPLSVCLSVCLSATKYRHGSPREPPTDLRTVGSLDHNEQGCGGGSLFLLLFVNSSSFLVNR